VVSVRSNVVVRLAPGGPFARVGGLTAEVRDVREHFAREIVLTRHLAAAGAPAVRPHEPAGPHEHAGHVVTLWQAVGDGPPPPGDQAGRALRACHEALRTLPRASASGLPGVTELLGEALGLVDAAAGLPRGDRLLLRGHLLRATAEVLAAGLPDQPLHGDAGPGNVLAGPAWNDWEDCCSGPVAWDLGCMVSSPRVLGVERDRAEAALVAYGPFPGDDVLDVFVHARAAQTAAWSAYTAGRGADGPGFPARTAARLVWLREQA
jgi:aminoglycoside phosphotransferase (APT) family kinase protein